MAPADDRIAASVEVPAPSPASVAAERAPADRMDIAAQISALGCSRAGPGVRVPAVRALAGAVGNRQLARMLAPRATLQRSRDVAARLKEVEAQLRSSVISDDARVALERERTQLKRQIAATWSYVPGESLLSSLRPEALCGGGPCLSDKDIYGAIDEVVNRPLPKIDKRPFDVRLRLATFAAADESFPIDPTPEQVWKHGLEEGLFSDLDMEAVLGEVRARRTRKLEKAERRQKYESARRWDAETSRVKSQIQLGPIQAAVMGGGGLGAGVAKAFIAITATQTSIDAYESCVKGSQDDCGKFAAPMILGSVLHSRTPYWKGRTGPIKLRRGPSGNPEFRVNHFSFFDAVVSKKEAWSRPAHARAAALQLKQAIRTMGGYESPIVRRWFSPKQIKALKAALGPTSGAGIRSPYIEGFVWHHSADDVLITQLLDEQLHRANPHIGGFALGR